MEQRGMGSALIELTGNRRAVIDGCDGIIDYDDQQVILRMGRLRVRICGRNLRLCRLTDCGAVVEGFLCAVEYETGGGH